MYHRPANIHVRNMAAVALLILTVEGKGALAHSIEDLRAEQQLSEWLAAIKNGKLFTLIPQKDRGEYWRRIGQIRSVEFPPGELSEADKQKLRSRADAVASEMLAAVGTTVLTYPPRKNSEGIDETYRCSSLLRPGAKMSVLYAGVMGKDNLTWLWTAKISVEYVSQDRSPKIATDD